MNFEEFCKAYKKNPIGYLQDIALQKYYNATETTPREREHTENVLLLIELIKALKAKK